MTLQNINIGIMNTGRGEFDLNLIDRWGNAFPTKKVNDNATWDLRTFTPFDWADLFLSREADWGGSTIEDAFIDCITDLHQAGLLPKLISFHPHIGVTANCHAWNAKYPFNNKIAFYELYSGTSHDALGVRFTTTDFKTNFVHPLRNADVGSFSYGYFQTREFDNNAAALYYSVIDNTLGNRGCQLIIRPSDGRIVWGVNENSSFAIYTPGSAPTSYIGRHTSMSRTLVTGADSVRLYINGSSVATISTQAVEYLTPPRFAGGEIFNRQGEAIMVSNSGIVETTIGSEYTAIGLTQSEMSDLHTILALFESLVR